MPGMLVSTIGWHRITRVFDPVKGWLTHHSYVRSLYLKVGAQSRSEAGSGAHGLTLV